MNSNVKSIVVLTAICLVITLALAGVNFVTAQIIAEADERAAFEACFQVMPSAENFETVELPAGIPETVDAIYRETSGQGYAFKITTKGYSSGFVILCGISADGTVTGTTVVSNNETPTIGGKCFEPSYQDQFLGVTAALEGVEVISGATYTSRGYEGAITDSFAAFDALQKGGSNG